MKILLICERLGEFADEGIANVARNLLRVLAERHEILALTPREWRERREVVVVRMNRFFLNVDLLGSARGFGPDVILYVPWTSGTPRTFLRAL